MKPDLLNISWDKIMFLCNQFGPVVIRIYTAWHSKHPNFRCQAMFYEN